jgi:hypothetical protein
MACSYSLESAHSPIQFLSLSHNVYIENFVFFIYESILLRTCSICFQVAQRCSYSTCFICIVREIYKVLSPQSSNTRCFRDDFHRQVIVIRLFRVFLGWRICIRVIFEFLSLLYSQQTVVKDPAMLSSRSPPLWNISLFPVAYSTLSVPQNFRRFYIWVSSNNSKLRNTLDSWKRANWHFDGVKEYWDKGWGGAHWDCPIISIGIRILTRACDSRAGRLESCYELCQDKVSVCYSPQPVLPTKSWPCQTKSFLCWHDSSDHKARPPQGVT